MSNKVDLDYCGCCEDITKGKLTPVKIKNEPGLLAIAYRLGTQLRFKASMSASIPIKLPNLTTRQDDDLTIGLIDAWATVADVLTFYQERIDYIINLQRTIGNQAVQGLMHSGIGFNFAKTDIQEKLKVSQPGDVYEQEADRVAEQVMRMSDSNHISSTETKKEERIHRKCSACEMKK